jgi:hypothetical protein
LLDVDQGSDGAAAEVTAWSGWYGPSAEQDVAHLPGNGGEPVQVAADSGHLP